MKPGRSGILKLLGPPDLLCRTRYLGHGDEEIMWVDLGGDAAWQTLIRIYLALKNMGLARFALDIDGLWNRSSARWIRFFGAKRIAAPATA